MARPCRIYTGFPRTRTRRHYSVTARALLALQRDRRRGGLTHDLPYRPQVLVRLIALALAASLCLAAAPPPAHRIVSLVPSLTEDLFAIGAGPNVVGVSSYTDYPPQAKRLPVVASFVSVATERIVALRPDVVVGIGTQAAQMADLRRAGLRTVLVDDESFDDIFRDIRAMGALTGREQAAAALSARLQRQTAALVRSVPKRAHKPSVLVVLGDSPIYTVGDQSYIAQLIRLAGGVNAASGLRTPYALYSPEALVARQPDVLIVDSAVRLGPSLAKPPWNALRAVRNHRVYTAPDGAALFRPGPRYNQGLTWLIRVLNT